MYAWEFVPRKAVSGEVAGTVRLMQLEVLSEMAEMKCFIRIGNMRRSKIVKLTAGDRADGWRNRSSLSNRGRAKSYVFF